MPVPKVLPETANSKPSIIPSLPATKVPSHSQSRVKKPKITTTESVIHNTAAMTVDELDSAIQAALNKEDTFPQERPVQEEIGKIGLMWPREEALDHETAPLLLNYATAGCSVDCGPNWTSEHQAESPQVSEIKGRHLRTPWRNRGKSETWILSSCEMEGHQGCASTSTETIPGSDDTTKSRLLRCILDLSFQLKHNGKILPSVNSETTKKAPQQSMAQLGLVRAVQG